MLFQSGDFKLHSGNQSNFKIECDALDEQDWQTIANIILDKYSFDHVLGVPNGGLDLECILKYHAYRGTKYGTLIVDDVLTTGKSMEELKASVLKLRPNELIKGVVLFARSECPSWITPIFQMWR